MSCALTQSYVLDCRDGKGGSKEFYLIEFEKIASMTLTAGVVTAITKLTGGAFRHYAQVKEVSECDEAITPNEANGSLYVKQTVKMVLNKRQATLRNEVMLLGKNRLVIVEVDQNGNAFLYGYQNAMLMAPSAAKSGKALGDHNGYELTFEGAEPELAYGVDPTIIAALTTPGT